MNEITMPLNGAPMMPIKKRKRRSHHKSRNGCLNCKRLRVKCDEDTPTCGNCKKRNRECEYSIVRDEPKRKKSTARKSSVVAEDDDDDDEEEEHVNTIVPISTHVDTSATMMTASSSGGGQLSNFNTPMAFPSTDEEGASPDDYFGLQGPLEAELLRHYIQHFEEIVLVYSGKDRQVWADYVPSLVARSPPVALGLLAVTALHMEKMSRGTRQLSDYAYDKYMKSLDSFKAIRESTSPSSAEATLLSSIFTMMLSYRFFHNLPLLADNSHGMDLISIARGPVLVAKNLGERLMESKVACFIDGGIELHDPDPDPGCPRSFIYYLLETCDAMDRLGLLQPETELSLAPGYTKVESAPPQAFNYSPASIDPTSTLHDNHNTGALDEMQEFTTLGATTSSASVMKMSSNADIYRRAIEHLNLTIKIAGYKQSPPMIMNWQMSLEPEFLHLARSNHPFAKVILIHHLVAMHSLRSYFWIGDKPRQELMNLVDQLGPRWRSFYAWPVAMIQREDLDITNIWHHFTQEAGPYDISLLW